MERRREGKQTGTAGLPAPECPWGVDGEDGEADTHNKLFLSLVSPLGEKDEKHHPKATPCGLGSHVLGSRALGSRAQPAELSMSCPRHSLCEFGAGNEECWWNESIGDYSIGNSRSTLRYATCELRTHELLIGGGAHASMHL